MASGDSLAELQAQGAENVLAFYDPVEKRIIVRGHDLGIGTEVTLAHELTHTLQDQHFDLQDHQNRLRTVDAIQPYRALVEGDAMRVESAYIRSLSAGQQQGAVHAAEEEVAATMDRAPWAAFAVTGGPYALGPGMVSALESDAGEHAIDLAFRTPPAHQVQLLNPGALLDTFILIPVPEPKLRHGERRVGPATPIGAMTLYATLAARLDPASAMSAADDWGGSSAVAFIRDGDACVRAAFRTEHPDGTAVLADALRAWASFGPGGTSAVKESNGEITLDACEQIGMSDDLGSTDEALYSLVIRNQLMLSKLADGVSKYIAKCVADELVADTDYIESLISTDSKGRYTPEQLQTLREHADQATSYCENFNPEFYR
jgi:hypothetical protein